MTAASNLRDPSAETGAEAGAGSDRRRWLALYVLCAGMLMIVLDATIVNVALPTIQDSLGFSQSNLAWVVNAYLIPFGGLLLLAGRIGDLVGQRRVFLTGLAIFTTASLVCAASESQGMLIGGALRPGRRRGAGLGGDPGDDRDDVPASRRDQAKAIGVYGFVASAGGSIGLLAGGALTQAISWHWIFLINLPIGIATAVGAMKLVEGRRGDRPQGGRRHPRRGDDHRLADARRLHDPRHRPARLGIDPDARAQRRLPRPAGRLHRAPGAHRQPADAAAPVPLAQRRRGQR